MSLIHWWPLNGDTRDYGIHNSTVTGSATFGNDGKIGKCLSSGTLTLPAVDCQTTFNKNGTSICFWAYLGTATYHVLFGYDGMTPPNNRRFTIFQYPDASSLHISWQNYDDSNAFVSDIAYSCVTPNAWNHICETWDGRYAKIYVNGVLVKTQDAGQGACYTDDWAVDTAIARASDGVKYNDVRIYDHALSQKEVKEISKGLVLHYNFEDPYVEGTTNYGGLASNFLSLNGQTIIGWSWGGTTGTITYHSSGGYMNMPYKVMHRTGVGSGGFYYKAASDIVIESGKTYTVSCYIKCSQDVSNFSAYSFNINRDSDNYYINLGRTFSLTTEWQRFTFTFTATSGQAGTYGEMSIIYGDTSTTDDIDVYYSGFQVEAKDHATPYVNGTREKENLVSSVSAGGHTVVDSVNSLHTDGTDADTYFFLNFNKPMTIGKTYYMTCDVSGFSSDQDGLWFPICSQSYIDNRILLRNGHCSTIFKYMESPWTTSTQTILDDNGGVRTNVIYITNLKVFELPDIYDNSGYGYHGILSGNPSILEDSGSGNYCLDLIDSGKYIKTNYMNFVDSGTIIVWAKYNSNGGSKMILSEDTSGMSSWYYVSAVDGSTWYSGNAGSITCYRDGIQTSEMLRDNQWHCYAFIGVNLSSWPGLVTICYYGFNNGYQFHGLIGDIKIFNTILSEADIKAEYNRKASIDRVGKLFAPYIKENNLDEELLPGTQLGPNAIFDRQGYDGTEINTSDGSLQITGSEWLATNMIPVVQGETYYYEIIYSNTENNLFYVGLEQYDEDGNSGINELCWYCYVSGDASARDHRRVFGSFTMSGNSDAGKPLTQMRLRILNNWNWASGDMIATIHHISLRHVTFIQPQRVEKNGVVSTNVFREDTYHGKTSFYKNGVISSTDIIEY